MADMILIVATLILITIYAAIHGVGETIRANRLEAKLQIVYALAAMRGHHAYTAILRDDDCDDVGS